MLPDTDIIQWNADGLVAAIAQDWQSGEVLMLAWMNREALETTVAEQRAVYWSRSRARLWRKGEESGNVQHLRELRVDCDGDALLLKVEQVGGIACHTGRRHCFFRRLDAGQWTVTDAVERDPAQLYGTPKRGDHHGE
jgi:phosphoribosyl-AMP cyclohydrolase